MSLSLEQLALICRFLCLPTWEFSRITLADSIMNFLLLPQMIDLKGKAPSISCEEFAIHFDYSKIDEIMLQERKSIETEEIQILPDVHLVDESKEIKASRVTFKGTASSFDDKTDKEKVIESGSVETGEIKIVANLQVPEQSSVMIPTGQQLLFPSNSSFSKTMNSSHILQACQNYDFRYQRELLKSGVTLNLNPDDYLNQTIGEEDTAFRIACAKYMKNYQTNQRHTSQETEDQAAVRRSQNALRMRTYRQSLRVLETEQQAAERRAQNALRMRNYRRFKRELEPELAAERRAQNAERMRKYRKIRRELEPETAALHRAQNALRMRNYRKNKRQQEPV